MPTSESGGFKLGHYPEADGPPATRFIRAIRRKSWLHAKIAYVARKFSHGSRSWP